MIISWLWTPSKRLNQRTRTITDGYRLTDWQNSHSLYSPFETVATWWCHCGDNYMPRGGQKGVVRHGIKVHSYNTKISHIVVCYIFANNISNLIHPSEGLKRQGWVIGVRGVINLFCFLFLYCGLCIVGNSGELKRFHKHSFSWYGSGVNFFPFLFFSFNLMNRGFWWDCQIGEWGHHKLARAKLGVSY